MSNGWGDLPGGIGFDINCGMRLVVTNLTYAEVKPHIQTLVDRLFQRVPAGVGSTGFVNSRARNFARWWSRERAGAFKPATAGRRIWSSRRIGLHRRRGCCQDQRQSHRPRGQPDRHPRSGNHYLEIQVAHRDHIHNEDLARRFGITIPDQVVVMFHCGSRGFGHQVATDYLQGLFTGDGEQVPYQNPRPRARLCPVQCA